MSDFSRVFGRVVRERREAKGLSQERFAEIAGIHRTYVSAIELGKVRLGLDAAYRVATGLGVPLSELIAAVEKENQLAAFEQVEERR